MGWAEAWRLAQMLATDPSSHIAAALAGWQYPVTREWIVAADAYDAFLQAHSKRKPKPYPRPWADSGVKRYGRATRPQVEIRAALMARGHGVLLHKRDAAGRLRDGRGRFVKG